MIEHFSPILAHFQVEEAKLLWAEGQQDMAVRLMQHSIQSQELSNADRAYTLSLAGKWLEPYLPIQKREKTLPSKSSE